MTTDPIIRARYFRAIIEKLNTFLPYTEPKKIVENTEALEKEVPAILDLYLEAVKADMTAHQMIAEEIKRKFEQKIRPLNDEINKLRILQRDHQNTSHQFQLKLQEARRRNDEIQKELESQIRYNQELDAQRMRLSSENLRLERQINDQEYHEWNLSSHISILNESISNLQLLFASVTYDHHNYETLINSLEEKLSQSIQQKTHFIIMQKLHRENQRLEQEKIELDKILLRANQRYEQREIDLINIGYLYNKIEFQLKKSYVQTENSLTDDHISRQTLRHEIAQASEQFRKISQNARSRHSPDIISNFEMLKVIEKTSDTLVKKTTPPTFRDEGYLSPGAPQSISYQIQQHESQRGKDDEDQLPTLSIQNARVNNHGSKQAQHLKNDITATFDSDSPSFYPTSHSEPYPSRFIETIVRVLQQMLVDAESESRHQNRQSTQNENGDISTTLKRYLDSLKDDRSAHMETIKELKRGLNEEIAILTKEARALCANRMNQLNQKKTYQKLIKRTETLKAQLEGQNREKQIKQDEIAILWTEHTYHMEKLDRKKTITCNLDLHYRILNNNFSTLRSQFFSLHNQNHRMVQKIIQLNQVFSHAISKELHNHSKQQFQRKNTTLRKEISELNESVKKQDELDAKLVDIGMLYYKAELQLKEAYDNTKHMPKEPNKFPQAIRDKIEAALEELNNISRSPCNRSISNIDLIIKRLKKMERACEALFKLTIPSSYMHWVDTVRHAQQLLPGSARTSKDRYTGRLQKQKAAHFFARPKQEQDKLNRSQHQEHEKKVTFDPNAPTFHPKIK